MKKTIRLLTLGLLLSSFSSLGLTSCNTKTTLDAPTDLTYDVSTGKFSFTASEGASTYTVGVSEIINKTTAEGIEDIGGSTKITLADGTEKYIWATQIGSQTSVKDSDGDGKVEGTLVFRSFSSSAANPGSVIAANEIPVGDFVLTVMADATTELSGSDFAYYEFSHNGALTDPSSFTGSFADASASTSKLSVSCSSNYFLNCLSTTGIPEYMEYKFYEDGTLKDTVKVDDYTYTNTVVGPEKSYTFTNAATVSSSIALDMSKKITATVQAVGNGSSKTSSAVCDVLVPTTTSAVNYATKYDCSGSGTAGSYTVTINVGVDSSDTKIYGVEVKNSNVVVARESGTFTTDGEISEVDGKKTYPENTVLTFTTATTDASSKIMDGKTLTVTKKEGTSGWGPNQQKTTNWALTGEGFTFNGTTFAFTDAASSSNQGGPGGGGPGGPM